MARHGVESLALLLVDERAEAEHRDRALVAEDLVHLERQPARGVRWGLAADVVDLRRRPAIVRE